jgi:hypothetical protein
LVYQSSPDIEAFIANDIANAIGLEILVDPFSLALNAEVRVRVSALVDIGFRYALAFCASSDRGDQ